MAGTKKNDGQRLACLSVMLLLLSVAGCRKNPAVEKQKYLQSGKTYQSQGKLKEAVIQFSNALKIDANFVEAHAALAKTYRDLGNIPAAYRELVRTVDLAPTNQAARIDLATMLVDLGAPPDKSLEQVHAVLAMNPESADAYGVLARIDFERGDLTSARSDIQHALAIDGSRSAFHLMLASIEARTPGGVDTAGKELGSALSLDPHNAIAHLYEAELMEKKGDSGKAETEYLAAVADAPHDVRIRAACAGFYTRTKQPAKAESTLREFAEQTHDRDEAADLLREYYVQTGQIDKAEVAYKELLAKYPQSNALRISYARVLVQKNEYGEAQKVVDQLGAKDSGQPGETLLRALLLIHADKLKDAFGVLQKAVENTPNSLQLNLLLAQVATKLGELSVAEASFRQVNRLNPENLDAEVGLAMAASRAGDAKRLGRIADETIAKHPDFVDAYLWRGTVEANQKLYDQAEADFRLVIRKDPGKADAYGDLGRVLVQENHLPEGRAMLEQALAKNPSSLETLNLLVHTDLAAKNPAKAISRVQDQIQKVPQNAGLYGMLAALQVSQKDFRGALGNAEKSMQLDPGSGSALEIYTQAQVALGNNDQVISTWERWSASHPSDPQAFLMLGTLEESKGNQAKAMEYYKKTLTLKPGQPLAANNLAYLMVEKGQDLNTALSLAQEARRGLPNSPDSADTLAWVYYHMRSYDWARDLLEEAVKGNPDSATVQYHLGLTYSRLKEKEKAEAHLNRAISIAPGTQTASDARNALGSL